MSRRTARDLASELGRLSRDVRTLQTATQLGSSSIEDGSTELYDEDDQLRQIIGIQPDGAVTVVDLNAPAPATPAAPTLTLQPGLLIVSSYGLTADGSEWLSDFRRIDVHLGTSAGFETSIATKVAEFGVDGGSVTLALDPATYYVKLVAVNTSNVPSAPSAELTADVTPPSTSTGGVATYHTADAPIGLDADDDGAIWYDTDSGNLPSRWDGATLQWVPMPLGYGAVSDGAVDGTTITAALIRTSDTDVRLELLDDGDGGALYGWTFAGQAIPASINPASWEDFGPTYNSELVLASGNRNLDTAAQAVLHLRGGVPHALLEGDLEIDGDLHLLNSHNVYANDIDAVSLTLAKGRRLNGFDYGSGTFATDANGVLRINHNLNEVPNSVTVTSSNNGSFRHPTVVNKTASYFDVRIENANGVLVTDNANVGLNWLAFTA